MAHARTTISVYANDRGTPFTLDVSRAMRLNLRYQFVLLYYNDERAHQALGYQTPAAFYRGLARDAA